MNNPADFEFTALLLCIPPGVACLGADSASPAAESTQAAGSKSGARPGEARPDNPFERMAQSTAQELRTNALFDGMDFEIFVAKPFVVLMTCESGADRGATDERKGRIDALARGVWHNWQKVRADRQLRSTRNDTLEHPEPFVWVALHSQDAYDQYIKRLVGPDNRDVAANQRETVACLDERIAILRQTPAIQDMHRRWAEWMRTTFEELPDAPGEDFSSPRKVQDVVAGSNSSPCVLCPAVAGSGDIFIESPHTKFSDYRRESDIGRAVRTITCKRTHRDPPGMGRLGNSAGRSLTSC